MAKSKEELVAMIETELVDPTSNKITGERMKNVLTDIVDAVGEGGSGGGSTMEYWSVPEESRENVEVQILSVYCPIIKCIVENGIHIMPGAIKTSNPDATILAVAFDRTYRFALYGNSVTMDDLLYELGWDDALFNQITEEEFYTT